MWCICSSVSDELVAVSRFCRIWVVTIAEVHGATVWKIIMLLLHAVRTSDLIYRLGKLSSCNWLAMRVSDYVLWSKLHIKSLFIGKSLNDSGKGWHVCNQALHALGCCTMTTPHVSRQSPSMNFWQKKAFLCFLSPHIHRMSVPVTYFYYPSSKTTWKDAILVLWIISRRA